MAEAARPGKRVPLRARGHEADHHCGSPAGRPPARPSSASVRPKVSPAGACSEQTVENRQAAELMGERRMRGPRTELWRRRERAEPDGPDTCTVGGDRGRIESVEKVYRVLGGES